MACTPVTKIPDMKNTLTASTALAACASSAMATIIDIDFGPAGISSGVVLTDTSTVLYVDFSTGDVVATASSPLPATNQLVVAFYTDSVGSGESSGIIVGNKAQRPLEVSGPYLTRFGYGTAVTQSGNNAIVGYMENPGGAGTWDEFTGVAFANFSVDGNEGWLALNYQAAGTGGFMEVLQLQYGTAGEQLTTPAEGTYSVIPEPTAAGALLAGSAAALALRRRRQAA